MQTRLVLAFLVALAGTARAQSYRVVSSTGGTGALPEASDEITYRFTQWLTGGDRKDAIEQRDHTLRLSELEVNQLELEHLPAMRAGERRRLRYFGNHGNECDHSGCGPKRSWDIELELVSVSPHHHDLPDGMHIGTAPLHVRRGDLRAPLPSDTVARLDDIRLRGDSVELDALVAPYPSWKSTATLRFTLDQLRARLADAEALDANQRQRWAAAMTSADRAVALDPSLDTAHLSRAWSLLGRGKLDDAAAALAPVIARNPVWVYWRLASTPALAKLLAHPAIQRLVAATPGTFEVAYQGWSVQTEPSGRFLAYYSDSGSIEGQHVPCGVITVIDRATLAVAVKMRASTCSGSHPTDAAGRKAAERTLRDLGFTSAWGETASLEPDLQAFPRFDHQQIEFLRSGVKLVPKGERADRGRVPIDVPLQATVLRAHLIGDVVVYRWRADEVIDGVALRVPASAQPPPAAPAAPPAPSAAPASQAAPTPPAPPASAPSRLWLLAALPVLFAAGAWLLHRRSNAAGK